MGNGFGGNFGWFWVVLMVVVLIVVVGLIVFAITRK